VRFHIRCSTESAIPRSKIRIHFCSARSTTGCQTRSLVLPSPFPEFLLLRSLQRSLALFLALSFCSVIQSSPVNGFEGVVPCRRPTVWSYCQRFALIPKAGLRHCSPKLCHSSQRLDSLHFVCHTISIVWFIQSSHEVYRFTFRFLLMRRCYFYRSYLLSLAWRRTSIIDYWWIESEVIHFVASKILLFLFLCDVQTDHISPNRLHPRNWVYQIFVF